MSETKKELSNWECFNWVLNETDPSNISIAIKVHGKLTSTLIQEAVNDLQTKYYLFNVVVSKDSSSRLCYFSENVHKIPLRWVKRLGEQQWLKEHASEIHTPFDAESRDPLVRVVFLQGKKRHEVLFTIHHMIIDGISCLDLAASFLKKICPPQTPSEDENRAAYQPLDSQLSLKDRENYGEIGSKQVEVWRNKARSLGSIENAKETGVIFKNLNIENTRCFLKRCKNNQLTVNSAVSAALMFALVEKMKKDSVLPEHLMVRLDCPINLRPFLARQPSNLGFYAATLTLYLPLSEINILTLGEKIQAQVHAAKNATLLGQTMQVVDLMMSNHFSGQEIKSITRAQGPYIGVSNLGRFCLAKDSKDMLVDAIYLSAALHGFFYTENSIYAVVHTMNDRLFFSFIYPKLLIAENDVEFIIARFFSLLGTLV